MAKMGRPASENPKQHIVAIRMTDEEYDKLKKYTQAHNQTITETMFKALSLLMDSKKA